MSKTATKKKLKSSQLRITKRLDTITDNVAAKERSVGGNISFTGLTNFISDIRHCPTREKEQERVNKELANIRKSFVKAKKKPLDGYQRKKYICKLVYMFTLGYEMESVNFVFMEAVKMLGSDVFSEKLIGYLGVSLLLHEEHEVIPMVIQSMQNDMESHLPLVRGLPLVAIANIGSLEMADTLSPHILRIAMAADSPAAIRKRAILAFLALRRKYPHLQTPETWMTKVQSSLQENDLGPVLPLLTLVQYLAKEERDEYECLLPNVIDILYRIKVKKEYHKEYVYCHMAHPWLQVRCFRILSLYPLVEEKKAQEKFFEVLSTITKNSRMTRAEQSTNARNTRNSVLFETINALIMICHETDNYQEYPKLNQFFQESFLILYDFMVNESTEPNFLYLTLDMLALVCTKLPEKKTMGKSYLTTVISFLNMEDITIRRRALDVLYGLCDLENSKRVISALMKYLQGADEEFREELVLKIAILAEKFAEDYKWYFDVILRLVTDAGEAVPDDIWHRVVRVTTNHPDVQLHAARSVWATLQLTRWNETAVKVAGYVLGEFGHLIAEEPGKGPYDQLDALHSKFGYCGNGTKVLLLNTYGKFASEYPEELGARLSEIFDEQRTSYDCEVQQRAHEYFALNEYEDPDLITAVMSEMPIYPEKKAEEESGDMEPERLRQREERERKREEREREREAEYAAARRRDEDRRQEAATAGAEASLPRMPSSEEEDDGDSSSEGSEHVPAPELGPGSIPPPELPQIIETTSLVIAEWSRGCQGFRTLVERPEGVLWESPTLQVGLKSQYSGSAGRFMLYYGNRGSVPLEGFSVAVTPHEELALMLKPAQSSLNPGEQVQQLLNFVCLAPYSLPPELILSFSAGGKPERHRLRLPIAMTKFLARTAMSAAEFLHVWRQLGQGTELREYTAVIKARPDVPQSADIAKATLESKLNMQVVPAVDPNPNNVVAVAQAKTREAGEPSVLARLQFSAELQLYKLSVRSVSRGLTMGTAAAIMGAIGDLNSVREEAVQL